MKATMKAVAQAAGVSTALVSYAFSRPDRLSREARARILAVADELGYTGPDPAGRTLRTGRAGAVGAIFTIGLSYAFSDPYLQEFLGGIAEETQLAQTGLLLLPFTSLPGVATMEEMDAAVEPLRRAVIDGAIADGMADDHPAVQVLAERELPLVRSSATGTGAYVTIDDRDGGQRIGRHVLDLGHREVAVVVASRPVGGSPTTTVDEDMLFPYARLRLAGIRDALGSDATIQVLSGGPNTAESGRAAARLALTASRPPTAIVAVTDVLALAVLDFLAEHGVRAGQDVSVTGFDDIPAAAAAGLTTVRQPIREKGRRMVRLLLDPDHADREVVLPTEFVPRASSGPAPEDRR